VGALLGWWSFFQQAVRYSTAAATTARDTVRYWTTDRQRAFVTLLFSSLCFATVVYLLAQLIDFTVTDGLTGPTSFMRVDYSVPWQSVFEQALSYNRWTVYSQWALLGTAVSIGLLQVAHLADIGPLESAIVGTWTLVLGIGILCAAYLAICAACLAIGVGLRSADAPVWLLVLMVAAIAFLALLPRLATVIREASGTAYDMNRSSFRPGRV
jgi:hypothetical protein